jgi:hypothetical protein
LQFLIGTGVFTGYLLFPPESQLVNQQFINKADPENSNIELASHTWFWFDLRPFHHSKDSIFEPATKFGTLY